MRVSLAIITMLAMSAPAFAQAAGGDDVPGRKAGQPTSDRTPQQSTTSPLDQTTQTQKGATSDRTPSTLPGGSSGSAMQHGGQTGADTANQQAKGGANTGRPAVLTPSKLRESLEKAGSKDIVVIDAAYLVHARKSDGDMIVMTINPPTIAAAMTGGSAGSGSSGSGSSEPRAYNPPSGSKSAP